MKKIAVPSENILNVNKARGVYGASKPQFCTSQVFSFSYFFSFPLCEQIENMYPLCVRNRVLYVGASNLRYVKGHSKRIQSGCKAENHESKPLFFNQIFDKKRLKALISWVFKQSGEAEALRVIDLLKETGFRHATKAGISIGLHDLVTPVQKAVLISESKLSIATTERDFSGARITATERAQRIIDTWHRASESLSKQVVDYFATYDRFNPVYIMALSGARGNFSQVRQLIGMRGLMADQQGKIVNFPIQSNLREGLTLTEYFISCSGARKGLVDTALRTADTGYLTRRLVDVSHHVVVKKLRCNTSRSLAFRSLQSYNKVLLPLKERLVGRVLAEDIFISRDSSFPSRFCEAKSPLASSKVTQKLQTKKLYRTKANQGSKDTKDTKQSFVTGFLNQTDRFSTFNERALASCGSNASHFRYDPLSGNKAKLKYLKENKAENRFLESSSGYQTTVAKQDQEISLKLASKIAKIREKVYLRSPLTCGFTHSVCQLCYGWSISQGSLVSLGDAVGVIAAQSIGEPGTQLTMRTFHTGGVFSGDLLQEIRAPHAGKIVFSKAFGGLLIRTAHGDLAFLSKSEGSVYISNDEPLNKSRDLAPLNARKTVISIPAFSLLFIRQGERVSNNQLLAEFSIRTKEGAQPIKSQQTIFAQLSGIIVEDCSGRVYTKRVKESALLLDSLNPQNLASQNTCLDFPKIASASVSPDLPISFETRYRKEQSELVKHQSQKKNEISSFSEAKPVSFSTCKAQIYTNENIENDFFSYLEPVQSGRLGFLKIISTRIGATLDYSYPIKSIDHPLIKKNKIHDFKKDRYCINLDFINSKSLRFHLSPYKACASYVRDPLPLSYKALEDTKHRFNALSPVGALNLRFVKGHTNRRFVRPYICTCKKLIGIKFSYVPRTCKSPLRSFPLCGSKRKEKREKKQKNLALFQKERAQEVKASLLRDKTLQFYLSKPKSKYLHPESIKENRFLLQTIAEYGDIVDETYKNGK